MNQISAIRIGNPYQCLDRNRPRRMVFYGRVSTEHEAQLSALENQIQWYDDQAKYHPNWIVLDKYIDEGITGTQARKRPAFLRMIEDAKAGKFDLIVTREVCRFARNTVDTLVTTRELKNIGVEVYFVEDNIWTMDGDGELRLTIMATLVQEESRKVSERVKAGQQVSRENGRVYGNGNILGYDRVGDTYVINPEQAETVRIAFDLYLGGKMGCERIANELTRLGRKNASGKVKWSVSNVMRIFSNPTCMGYQAYGKSYSNNYLEQKRINNHDASTYYYRKADYPPIVTEEEWHRAEAIRKERTVSTFGRKGPDGEQKKIKRGKHQSSDLWVNKLRCGCGSSFRKDYWHKKNGVPTSYGYVCYNQLNNGSARQRIKAGADPTGYCSQPMIADWKLDLMANELLNQIWKDRASSIKTACQLIDECLREDPEEQKTNPAETELAAAIERLRQKRENYMEMRANGEITKEKFAEQKRKIDRELDEMRISLESVRQSDSPAETAGFSWEKVHKALAELCDPAKPKEEILRKVVDRIVPNGSNDFTWYLKTGGAKPAAFHLEGRKNHAAVSLDEFGDEDSPAPVHRRMRLPGLWLVIPGAEKERAEKSPLGAGQLRQRSRNEPVLN